MKDIKTKLSNRNLNTARIVKNDDFYTQLSDIEKELKHYKEHFKGKTVFCNCDDPEESKFWEYFSENFNHLGLKKLIATHCKGGGVDYWIGITKRPYKKEIINGKEQPKEYLKNNGDFRSTECIKILKECDIVVTNPPFSLFREYVAQLMEYKKKFIIIGNMNAITYKEVFPLIKDNKIWLGMSPRSMTYILPDKSAKTTNAVWFTNLDITKRHEYLILYKEYNSEEYPKYDDYDAIEVSEVKNIPMDYDGAMGVPISFIDKYNPYQFEIIDQIVPHVNGKRKYVRNIIKNKKVEK